MYGKGKFINKFKHVTFIGWDYYSPNQVDRFLEQEKKLHQLHPRHTSRKLKRNINFSINYS